MTVNNRLAMPVSDVLQLWILLLNWCLIDRRVIEVDRMKEERCEENGFDILPTLPVVA